MLVERKVLTATVVHPTKILGLYTSIVMVKCSKSIVLLIGVDYWGGGGARASQRFYKGGSAPAEILLNLIAVTIRLANPETLDAAKKDNIYT